MLTKEQARRLSEKILSYSKFPECTVTLSSTEQVYVRFANNGITTSGFSKEPSIVVASTRDGKTGVATTTEADDASLRRVVQRSEELAALAPANPEHMDALGPQQYPEAKDYDEETAQARSPAMLPHIRAVIDAAAGKKLVAAGFFERTATSSSVANKKGLYGYHPSTDARMSTTVRTPDGSSSGWDAQPSVRIREINGAALAARAIDKCVQWKSPRRLDPGKYTVVLEPTAVGDLVRLMAFSFDGRSSEEGRTFLSKKGGGTQLGEKLFPEFITLRSDPLRGRLPGAPWTNSLLPNRPVVWIEKGVVRNLAYDRYWAAKLKREPVPFPNALILDGGDTSRDDLIRSVDRGLLVTHFWYIRAVNMQTLQQTGLTRDGLFLIEKGKIAAPVMNFRFNESPVRMLQNAVKLGRAIRVRGLEGGSMIAPAIVAENFTFTSVSDAV